MTRYEELITGLRAYIERADAFERRGKSAVATVFQEFAKYLEVPQGVCWVGPPGVALDEDKRYPLHDFAELRPDGFFAGSMIVSERGNQPFGAIVRFTFYVRLQEGALYSVASGDKEPLRPMTVDALTASALVPFFERILELVTQNARTSPEKLAMDEGPRPIGFTAVF